MEDKKSTNWELLTGLVKNHKRAIKRQIEAKDTTYKSFAETKPKPVKKTRSR